MTPSYPSAKSEDTTCTLTHMATVRLLEVLSKPLGHVPNYKFRHEKVRTVKTWTTRLDHVLIEKGRQYNYRGHVVGAVVTAFVTALRDYPVLYVQHDDGFALQVYVGPRQVQDYSWWRPTGPRWDSVRLNMRRGQVAYLALYWFDIGGFGILRLRPVGLREVTPSEAMALMPLLAVEDAVHVITELAQGGVP